ncbi:SDR family NAD(P)-dependent oxidoreductase [Paenibacillus sp. HN-1]|uniref:SDR family NAD(P)-dependent oxidoreductase n=1 Tax=Paenibacillus TaxID=44249 RepID=UPI001CA9B9DB|nr:MULTISPECIES: SDR family NAD(P)-dependent oxidoreductase [Paenibacillus]MBY9078515.1 SDR family NAD(P)-dependent oxidoreductase [Paenibacillus sp. CGMCC 1.18879]MBY9082808.1 SDR family NAD(P)-dependent oxidoreductase [Paenibacillus sinensis]
MNRKIALVTGANRGIGFEISRQLGRAGITVLMAARSIEAAEDAAKRAAEDQEIDAIGVKLDVSSPEDIAALAEWIDTRYGRLDILVNNAGILKRTAGGDAEAFRQTFEVNTVAPFQLTESLLPLLLRSDAGRIVNQSSAIGSLKMMLSDETVRRLGDPGYAASKAALNMLTVYWAQKLEGTAVKVNSAHPGLVKTDMTGDSGQISAEEGAGTAVKLALLGPDGPSGSFFYKDKELPW